MSVALPTVPVPWAVTPRLLDFGGLLEPPMGGVSQRFSRLGSRWAVDFVFPPMAGDPAKAFLAALFKARAFGSTLLATWPQPAFPAAIGSPVVNGANQTGSSLIVDGLTASTALLKAGTFFSVVVGSRSYLYCTTDNASVNGSGQSTLAIAPMLRVSPADDAALVFATPKIEGFSAGAQEQWTLERLAWTTAKLTLTEVA